MKYTFRELASQIKQLNSKNSDPWPPELQLVWIYEELGEFSGELLKLSRLEGRWSKRKTAFDKANLKEELGDVLYGLVSLAQNLDIDLLSCLESSIKKFGERKKNSLS